MSHAHIEQLLAVYRDLSETERHEVDQHLQHCPTCAARLADYKAMDQALSHLVRPRAEARLRQAFYSALETPPSKFGWTRTPVRYASVLLTPMIQVAAVALLVVVLWLALQGQLRPEQPAAVTPQVVAPAPAPAEIQLHYLSINENNLESEVDRALIEQFETDRPEVKIIRDTLRVRSINQVFTAAAPRDVLRWRSDTRIRTLIGQGLLLDISDVWSEAGWQAPYPSPFQTFGTVDGKQYLLPVGYTWFAIYYHKPTFERYGLAPPQTWDELLAVSEALKQNGVVPIIHPNPQVWPALAWFSYLNMRLNGPEFHHNLMQGRERFDTPQVRAVFERWRVLLENDYYGDELVFSNLGRAAQFMIEEKGAMILSTPDLVASIPAEHRDEFDFFRVPIIDPAVPIGETVLVESYFIPANAREPETAKAFLTYLGSTEAQAYIGETFGAQLDYVPIHPDIDPRLLSPATQRGWTLVESADQVIQASDRDIYELDLAAHLEAALNKFLADPDNIDTILVALEELHRATVSGQSR